MAKSFIDVISVDIIPSPLTLSMNTSETLISVIKPDNASNKAVTWKSNNPSVATVDEGTGKVTTLNKEGTATITATAHNGVTGTCVITVNPIPVIGVEITPNTLTLNTNSTGTLTETVTPADATNKKVEWTSSNTTIATVDKNTGIVTAKAVGSATITAIAHNGVTGTSTVTVVQNAIDVISVEVTPNPLTLSINQIRELTKTIKPANATEQKVEWTSSNPAIAEVDKTSGIVTAKAAGSAIITATAHNGVTGTCAITVNPIPVISVEITPSPLTLNTNSTGTLTEVVMPADATNKKVEWTSSDPAIAEVDKASGIVTARSAGAATITATAHNGVTGSCIVTVNPIDVISVEITPNPLTLNTNSTGTLAGTILPADATNKSVEWESSNTTIATVDKNTGIVTAHDKEGSVTITATAHNGVKGTSTVTVIRNAIAAISVEVIPNTLTIVVNDPPKTLAATVRPDHTTDKKVEWTSSNENIATVNRTTGVVTAKSAGEAIITATAHNGVTGSCSVTVNPDIIPVTKVLINKTTLTLNINDPETLTATVEPTNATDKTIKWRSNNTTVATVDEESGLVTAKAAGEATIIATAHNGVTGTCTVTVNPALAITPDNVTLDIGKETTLTINRTGKTPTWSSASTAVATVDASGKVKGITAGNTKITATVDGQSATCDVTVSAIDVTKVILNKTTLTLEISGTETLTATVEPSNATDKKLTWSSSSPSVVTVDNAGKVSAIAWGTVTITATAHNGMKAECEVTVNKPNPVLVITPDKVTLDIGKETVLTVNRTGVSPKWSSGNTTVATVEENTGKVKAIAAGEATITVDVNGLKTTSIVTVNPVLAITPNPVTLIVKSEQELKVNITGKPITWSSGNTAIATVDASGRVKAIAKGTTIITATVAGQRATCDVIVNNIDVIEVILNKTTLTLNINANETLTATVRPDDATDQEMTWSSSNTAVATVDNAGKVIAEAAGTATITATAHNGVKGTCTLTVNPVIQISTATELAAIATKGLDKECILMNDITLNNWIPIGNPDTPFKGKFNGNGHKITINSFGSLIKYNSDYYAGLFGFMSEGSEVQNLIVQADNNLSIMRNDGGNIYFGVITGYLEAGTITNCSTNAYQRVSNNSSSFSYVGGIVGYIGNRLPSTSVGIQKCYTTGNISVEGGGSNYAGGIVGYMVHSTMPTIQNCYTTGDVIAEVTGGSGSNYAGGIAGYMSTSVIQYCYATGKIGTSKGSSNYSGGIAAFIYGSHIKNSVALNREITGSINARIGHTDYVCTLSANYGSTTGTWESNASGRDGADCAVRPTESWWKSNYWAIDAWDLNAIWQWDSATGLPKLRNTLIL